MLASMSTQLIYILCIPRSPPLLTLCAQLAHAAGTIAGLTYFEQPLHSITQHGPSGWRLCSRKPFPGHWGLQMDVWRHSATKDVIIAFRGTTAFVTWVQVWGWDGGLPAGFGACQMQSMPCPRADSACLPACEDTGVPEYPCDRLLNLFPLLPRSQTTI